MTAAIDCRKLSKRYGRSPGYALKDLTLQVNPGEVYGFLGPNGAGKSTAIRTLLNFIQPSGGSATILGHDIVKDSLLVKREIGYLAGEVALYRQLTGRQFLDYMAALQPVKDKAYVKALRQTFQAQLDKPIEELSKGNRQKIGILQAFMHQPKVLILDEPTSGLDPLMQAAFFETVQAAKQRGAAVFLSSHDLNEVRKMCDRIGFIRDGQLVAERAIADLQRVAAHSFDITFAAQPPLAQLKKLHGAEVHQLTPHGLHVRLHGDLTPLLKILATSHVTALDQSEVNLEDEFLAFYQTEAVQKEAKT